MILVLGGKTGSPGCKVSREVAPEMKPCDLRDKLCGYMINGTVINVCCKSELGILNRYGYLLALLNTSLPSVK